MKDKKTLSSKRRAEKIKKRRRALAAPFFTVLFVLGVVALIIPLRPTESMREKRRLAQFPELTVKTLFSGDFFDGVSTWYSDTFPGRETWLDVATVLNNSHGITTNVISYSQLNQPASQETLPQSTVTMSSAPAPLITSIACMLSPYPSSKREGI